MLIQKQRSQCSFKSVKYVIEKMKCVSFSYMKNDFESEFERTHAFWLTNDLKKKKIDYLVVCTAKQMVSLSDRKIFNLMYVMLNENQSCAFYLIRSTSVCHNIIKFRFWFPFWCVCVFMLFLLKSTNWKA